MKKIKVGYLPLYIKLYDDSNPAFRDPVVAWMEKLAAMLEDAGMEIVMADEVCRVKDEFARAAAKFNAAGVDAVITQHLAYSPSLESIDALLSLEAPIIVLDTTPDYQLLSVADHRDGIMDNHGIHGVQDMCSLLKRHGKPYYLCVGHALHSGVIAEAAGLCRAAAAAKAFRTAKIGSVGGSFPGMGDFLLSDERFRSDIGAQVEYMTRDIIPGYLAQVTEEEVDAELALDAASYTVEVTQADDYRAATRSGLAVRKWMADRGLTSCTVNFLTLDECGLPKMPFVECCKIMERGLGYAGEGDVLTAGLVGALMHAYPNTAFTEMFCPDWEQDVILLSHMGESNPRLAQWRPIIADKPFNYNSCGDTAAMYTCFRPGRAVFVNLAPMDGHFSLVLSECTLLAGREDTVYRNATQGWLKPAKPLPQFLKEFSLAGGTHHSALVYDANVEELKAFGEMMGFRVTVI